MKLFKKIESLLKIVKFHRIVKALSIYRKHGWNGVKYHFLLVRDKEKGLQEEKGRQYDIRPICEYESLEQYEPLAFLAFEEPLVSIIIPVYNQFAYTYNCLSSIKKHSENISYEIIVADDCSTDFTAELEKIVEGIRVVHNKENCQFLVNCNRASKNAKGKYLVFLNNDTQVQKCWLKALVELMETEEKIGLAGSKLVYPNGLVQEAGGIVWKDANVLQYGNGRQAGEEELNFLRETDYISGASIIIRKKLWDEIGGFDERFTPAYYEDVDLAFQVREKGFRVVYQPESEAVHFEGVTEKEEYGKNGIISRNRETFETKWKIRLGQVHFEKKDYLKVVQRIKK